MILGLPAGVIALGLLAALLAGVVRGMAGFGLAILLVPLLGLVATPREAVVAGNLLGVLMGFSKLRRVVSEAEASAWPIALLAVAACPLGVTLLGVTPGGVARLMIALIAIAAFGAILAPPKPADHRPSQLTTAATGVASGILTGFAGMPGPPVVPYYLRRALPPAVARSSMLAVFFAASFAGASVAFGLGVADWNAAILALVLWPAAVLGNAIGFRLHDRVRPRVWRVITAATLGASAFVATARLASGG